MPGKDRILVFGEGKAEAEAQAGLAGSLGYEVEIEGDTVRLLQRIVGPPPIGTVLLSARDGDRIQAAQLLPRIRAAGPFAHVILATDRNDLKTAVTAMRAGAHDCLPLPLDPDELRQALDRLRAADPPAPHDAPARASFITVSPRLAPVLAGLRRVADSTVPILIQGETGTGKELIAQIIHGMSRRADKPFVPVVLGALSAHLVESELFGHRRGAFTGAIKENAGYFGRAADGTILLVLLCRIRPTMLIIG